MNPATKREWYFDPRFIVFVAHTALIAAFFLSVVVGLHFSEGLIVTPFFMCFIGLVDLPALGLLIPFERWAYPGLSSDLRFAAIGLAVFGGAQWVAITHILVVLQGGRRRVPDPGKCRRCEYDLTGNVSGVCPECGTAIAPGCTNGGPTR